MSTKQIAQGLASLGRNGDTMLMHVTPEEVTGLQALAETQGTSLTVNPNTGLPEAFSLGGVFKSLLPTIAGFGAAGLTGGAMSPMLAGILAGALAGAATNKDDRLMGGVMGGLGGYGGANLLGAAKSFTPALAEQAVNQSGGTMAQAMLDPTVAQQIGGANLYSAPTAKTAGIMGSTGELGAPMASNGLEQAIGNVASNPMGFIGANKAAVGMPIGTALLGGLEEKDFMGRPIKTNGADKYDPRATLNLNTDSGLRLYAEGGTVNTGGITSLYNTTDNQGMPQLSQNGYGMGRLNSMMQGGMPVYAEGGYLDGAGDGMSDDIPAVIEGDEPARLADGEFVVPADVVSHIGNGSSKAGAQELYRMLDRIRMARTGRKEQGKEIDPDKYLPA